MKELRKAINELSEVVDERIAVFTWRELVKPRNWHMLITGTISPFQFTLNVALVFAYLFLYACYTA